jgi:hypothetical protein
MPVRRWRGGAAPVKQVTEFTVGGTPAAGQVYSITINGRAVSYTAVGADTNTTIATKLKDNLVNSSFPEFLEVVWTSSSNKVTGEAVTAGRPYTATSSASGGGTLTANTTTAAAGPNFWNLASNWHEGAVPATNDDVIIDGGPSILYGIDQGSVTLASLRIGPGFGSSEIGLPRFTAPDNSPTGYPEYRTQRLNIKSSTVTIDSSSSRIRLNLGNTQTTITVLRTGPASSDRDPAVEIIGSHASNVLRVLSGSVGVSHYAGDASQFATIEVAHRGTAGFATTVSLGSDLTLATLKQTGGIVVLACAVTTITKERGELHRQGSGAVTTLNNFGGEVYDEGTGTITTLRNAGEYSRVGSSALTITNAYLYAGSSTDDTNGTITWTNPVELQQCRLPGSPQATIGSSDGLPAYFNPGRNKKLTVQDI